MEGDDEYDEDINLEQEVIFLVSGFYLILVGITGATFNIRALTKAKRVSIFHLLRNMISYIIESYKLHIQDSPISLF